MLFIIELIYLIWRGRKYRINYLNIQNIGIIEDITVEFFEGFNVLTGETGAGKALIIDSLIFIGGR